MVSAVVCDRVALRWRNRSVTHAELTRRTRRLANLFVAHGLGQVVPREKLPPWEAGQDFVGVLMYNRPEYIEILFGAFKARCIPYNINVHYQPAEIRELLSAA